MLCSGIAAHLQTLYWAERRYGRMIFHNSLVAVVNISVAYLLVDRFGVGGLALAFSIASMFSVFRLLWLVRRDYLAYVPARTTFGLAKLAVTGSLLAGGLRVAAITFGIEGHSVANPTTLITLAIASLVAAAFYFAVGRLSEIDPFPALSRTITHVARQTAKVYWPGGELGK